MPQAPSPTKQKKRRTKTKDAIQSVSSELKSPATPNITFKSDGAITVTIPYNVKVTYEPLNDIANISFNSEHIENSSLISDFPPSPTSDNNFVKYLTPTKQGVNENSSFKGESSFINSSLYQDGLLPGSITNETPPRTINSGGYAN